MVKFGSSKVVPKVFRFIAIYGLRRTLIKGIARLRFPFPAKFLFLSFFNPFKETRRVWVIGAGHHAVTCLAYFSLKNLKINFVGVVDPNEKARSFFIRMFGACYESDAFNEKLITQIKEGDYVFISSDHKTHSLYAEQFLELGCHVHIEKPICTDLNQLKRFDAVAIKNSMRLYAGFNRPFSPAFLAILSEAVKQKGASSVSWAIYGHKLSEEHWYRDAGQGSRVLGNLSHWLDLSLHYLLKTQAVIETLEVSLVCASDASPSDNISVVMRSDHGDIVCLNFSSRGEPFDGVKELGCFARGDFNAEVRDFRSLRMDIGSKQVNRNYFPKDGGHEKCATQMFGSLVPSRSWEELRLSCRLLFFVEEMLKNRERQGLFSVTEGWLPIF